MCNKRNKLNKFILSVMTVSVLCTSIPQSVEAKTSGYEIITSNSEESGGGFFSKLLSFFNIKKFTSKKEDKDISTVEIKEDDSLEEPKKETSTEVDEEVIEFRADKPFTYYILDDSGNVYFAGRYVKAE